MRLLLTRPQEDSAALAERLAVRGHEAVIEPLLAIKPDLDAALDLDGVSALVLTSANGARAFALRSARRDLPVLAVGDATAVCAREVGFTDVASAAGDVDALVELVRRTRKPDQGALLHVAGKAIAGDLAGRLATSGYTLRRAVLYAAEPVESLSESCVARLRAGEIDGAMFFSPRTAAAFVSLVGRAGVADATRRMTAFGLSPAVIDALAPLPWARRVAAATPNEAALLAAIDDSATRTTMEPPRDASPPTLPPAPPARRGAAALVAALAALLVAIAAFLDLGRPWNIPPRPALVVPPDLVALAPRLDTLSREFGGARGELARRADALEARQGAHEQRLVALVTALEAASGRLERLEQELRAQSARPRETTTDPVALAAAQSADASAQRLAGEMAKLREDLAALAREAAQRPPPAPMPPAPRVETMIVAIGQLREALAAGKAYATELATARRLAESNAAAVPLFDRLAAHAERGAPTLATLRERLPAAATAAIRAVHLAGEGETWWRTAIDRLASLVAVRRVGEIDGEDVEALLARAERRLEAGDLAAALALLDKAPPPALSSLAPWLTAARARLAVDAALAELTQLALRS